MLHRIQVSQGETQIFIFGADRLQGRIQYLLGSQRIVSVDELWSILRHGPLLSLEQPLALLIQQALLHNLCLEAPIGIDGWKSRSFGTCLLQSD